MPLLPLKMSPSQAARTAELLDFLHQQITLVTENIKANDSGEEIELPIGEWQRILTLRGVLSRYTHSVRELDALQGSAQKPS